MEKYISIPKPCYEDWNKMSPNNKGRFCVSCSKTVVDFTQMNREEIHTYFKQNSEKKTCGHFYASQLEDSKKPKTSIFKRVNYLATILLGLFLPLTSCKKQVTGEPAMIEEIKSEKKLTGDTVYTGDDHEIPPVVDSIVNKSDNGKTEIVVGMTLAKIKPKNDSLK